MADHITVPVLDLRPGDRVQEQNAEWPQPFCNGPTYSYTVDTVERINADTIMVGVAGSTSAIQYEPGDTVAVRADRTK